MSENKSKGNNKNKIFYEGKKQKPSPLYVSLDNADTVIEVAHPSASRPGIRPKKLNLGAPPKLPLLGWELSRRLGEGILDLQIAKALSMLQVFAVEGAGCPAQPG